MLDRWTLALVVRMHIARSERERGDVPGWVMITLMTVAVATAIWGLVNGSIMGVLRSALESVTGGRPSRDAASKGVSSSGASGDDGGAAVVEFVLVAAFVLIPLFLAILQLALVLHSRNIVVASAAVGARYGASADSTAAAGADEACRRIHAALPRVRRTMTCAGGYVAGGAGADPVELVEVAVKGPVPMFFLPWGSVRISVTGHAVRELAP